MLQTNAGLAQFLHLQENVQKLNGDQKKYREELDKMIEVMKRLSFVNQDMFVRPETLEHKVEEIQEFYRAKIDRRMSSIESNFIAKMAETEQKCTNKVLGRVSKADFHSHINSVRIDLQEAIQRTKFVSDYTDFLRKRIEAFDPSLKHEKMPSFA